ncbi:MAG: flagellar basal-body rod protein FlgF [Nitrospinota bacterium]|nr:flagellar basal-body rod protein FlgF [Nitrospinota bacterium]
MDESIFVAVSGIMKQERKMEILSNNLANMNNVGFKKDQLAFEALLSPFKKDTSFEASRNVLLPASKSNANIAYVGVSEFATDNTQGTLEKTDNSFDLALEGEGYFSVQTPDGVRYTRKGNFQLDSQGRLTTQNGVPVLTAQGAPLIIQGGGGAITIDINGNVSAGAGLNNLPVGQIKVTKFNDGVLLEKEGDGLFKLKDPTQQEVPAPTTRVRQGYLEQSNVSSVEEMTKMMAAVRAFEGLQKLIQGLDQVDGTAANNLGRLNP